MFTYFVVVSFRLQADNGRADAPVFRTAPVEVLADNDTDAGLAATQLASAIRFDQGIMPVGHVIVGMIA